MKFSKVYFDREFFAEKLGVNADQLAIAEVTSQFHEIEITLAIDDNAITKGEIASGTIHSSNDLRRFKI